MIILTTLGLGRKIEGQYDYSKEIYQWNGKRKETALFQEALAEWFPEAQMIVLATKRAKEERSEELRQAVPQAYLPVDIPDGRSDDEFWNIFDAIAKNVPENETVILDITHGFRSIPMLGLLSLSFLRVAKKVEIKHVLYGALDARLQGQSEVDVFDLAPFLKMLNWANATDRFLETGDAGKFKDLLHELQELSSEDRFALNRVGKKLEALSNDLLAGRQTDPKGNGVRFRAHQLMEGLEKSSGAFTGRAAPYALLNDRIQSTYQTLALPKNATPERKLFADWALVSWYATNGHWIHAILLAREWCVSLCCWKAEVPLDDETERKKQEQWLGAVSEGEIPLPEGWETLIKLSRNLNSWRNDVAHFKGEHDSTAVRDEAKALPGKLREAALTLGIKVGE